LRTALTTTSIGLTAYTFGALYPTDFFSLISPRVAPPPLHPDHPDALAIVNSLESQLLTLPSLNKLRSQPDADEWYETRPHLKLPEERRVNNLTAGALRGPGRLAVLPLCRAKRDESEGIIFLHVGRGLCGHDGIVHGGLIATLLDESLARTAILNLPDKVGMTVNLNINYRAPTRADQFIVIKTKLEEAKGRKAVVTGIVEDLEGTVLAEARGVFVQPRHAKFLNSSAVKDALGQPPVSNQPTQSS